MPGIAGIISDTETDRRESVVGSMIQTLNHEKSRRVESQRFDRPRVDAGYASLGDRPSSGRWSSNADRSVHLLLTGELFGIPANTSDAAWVFQLYERERERFVRRLNGLFSGLLVDERNGMAYLFNDRYGMERIYAHESDGAVYFASEAKALLRVMPELREFDETGVAQYLAFGCTLKGKSLFKGIDSLPGASLWTFENGRLVAKESYFSFTEWESLPPLSAEEFQNEFEARFRQAVPRYFVGDSALGISLTAGLDTRMIMATAPLDSCRLTGYTFSGLGRHTLDARIARKVASQLGLNHRNLDLEPDFLTEFPQQLDRTVYLSDGYLGLQGAHEVYLNAKAREVSPVRITGVFGGEIFRGVSMFKPSRLSKNLLSEQYRQAVSACEARNITDPASHPVTNALSMEIPLKRFGTIAAGRTQTAFRSPFLDNEVVPLAYQAPPAILDSPEPSLRLVQANAPQLARIPTDMGISSSKIQTFARRAYAKATFKLDYYCSEGLPGRLAKIDKMYRVINESLRIRGLHKFLQYKYWSQNELADFVRAKCSDAAIRGFAFWNRSNLDKLADDHVSGRANRLKELNAILTLESVDRQLFRELPRDLESVSTEQVTDFR